MASKEQTCFVVVDIGGTKIRTALWDGESLTKVESMATPKVSAPQFLQILNGHLQTKLTNTHVQGIGISSAGPIDVDRGVILNPANLGNGDDTWLNFDIKSQLLADKNLPCSVDNDAAMTAYGQFHYVEKANLNDLVVLTLGTGVGVAAIVQGQLARAGQHMHPEVGHLLVGDEPDDSHQTPFGNFPTLESYLSGHHFSRRVERVLRQPMSGEKLIELSEQRHPEVLKLWEQYSRRMALCLANLSLCYFPKKIVLAGGFAEGASQYFLESTRNWLAEIMASRRASGMADPVIEISAFYNELPLFGAGYKIQHSLDS